MKKQLRKTILQQRRGMDAESVLARSSAIFSAISALDAVIHASIIHIYYPINNEVDTRKFIQQLWQRNITVIMPRTDFTHHRIINFRVDSFDQLEPTTFSMMEPKLSCKEISREPDVVIVPGVAFDRAGNRMGYGGGFYDRFLANTAAIKIAPAYTFQLKDAIPAEAHDVTMDYVICPDEQLCFIDTKAS